MREYSHGGDIYGGAPVRLDCSVNTNPLGIPAPVLRAVRQALPSAALYPDPHCRALREALAAAYALSPAQILCGNGASELVMALWAALRPRRTLLSAPTFSEYARAARLHGGGVQAHPLLEPEQFALTPRILEDITPQTGVVALCNPNNPTGRLCDPALLRNILVACRRAGAVLLLDECFIEFTGGQSMLPFLAEFPNLLILRALTKSHAMAGLRLGMLCGNEELLGRIGAFLPVWNVSVPAQAGGAAAAAQRGWMEATRRLVARERGFMEAALRGLGLTVYPGDANFLLVRSKLPLAAPLREQGILVRDCASFEGLDERYIRIGLKKREGNEMLLRAIVGCLSARG